MFLILVRLKFLQVSLDALGAKSIYRSVERANCAPMLCAAHMVVNMVFNGRGRLYFIFGQIFWNSELSEMVVDAGPNDLFGEFFFGFENIFGQLKASRARYNKRTR